MIAERNKARSLFLAILLIGACVSGVPASFSNEALAADNATIRLGITSAGIPLQASDGKVLVFSTGADKILQGRAGIAQPIAVPAGTYDIRFIIDRARDRPTVDIKAVTLVPGQRYETTIEVALGELTVSVQDSKKRATGHAPARVQVFAAGRRTREITSMAPGERIWLSAGLYDLRTTYLEGTRELAAKWRTGISIQAGIANDIAVAFQRGWLRIDATNAALKLDPKQAEIWVYEAGDVQQRVVEKGQVSRPVNLAVGRYDVRVRFIGSNDRAIRWIKGLEVIDGDLAVKGVRFTSGKLTIDARLQDGPPLETFDAYVYVYREGDHETPVAYLPAGHSFILEQGRYDLRVHYRRSDDQPDIWLRKLTLTSGEAVRRSVEFPSARLLLRVLDQRGEELIGDNIFVFAYAEGARAKPVSIGRSGKIQILTAGRYALRIEDTRNARSYWLAPQNLVPGKLIERVVQFRAGTTGGVVEVR